MFIIKLLSVHDFVLNKHWFKLTLRLVANNSILLSKGEDIKFMDFYNTLV